MAQDLLLKLVGACFGLSFAGVGCYIMYSGRKKRAQSDRLDSIETLHISGLQPGRVSIEGTVSPAEDATVMESPIEKQTAVAYHVTVEEWEEDDGGWKTIHEEQRGLPMTVSDGTGEIRVELPSDGRVDVEQTQTRVDSDEEPPERIQQYVENEPAVDVATRHQYGPVSTGDWRRYSEGVIEPGEEVCVVGAARDLEGGWGEQTHVVDEPPESGEYIISDKSKAELVHEEKKSGRNRLALGGAIVLMSTLFSVIFWVNA